MLRQSLIYLILSILVVFFARFAHLLIVYLDMVYAFLTVKLAPILSQIGLGITVRKVILLVLTPLLIAAIPALVYRLIKGSMMPYFKELVWCLWLIITLSSVLIRY